MRQPAIYIGHGAPLVALENTQYNKDLRKFSQINEKPEAIISVSAHWEIDVPIQITISDRPPQIYDFWGFPRELYETRYSPIGNPALAQQVMQEFDRLSIPYQGNPKHGLDHGTWIPLSIMYPDADIPVIQISVPRHQSPAFIMRMGEALSKFREQGVLLMGSGNIVHNLRLVRGMSPQVREGPVDDWAAEFDEFIKNNLVDRNYEKIKNYRDEGPSNHLAVPTTEHFNPLFFMMGATKPSDGLEFISEEFQYNNISMRSVQLNP